MLSNRLTVGTGIIYRWALTEAGMDETHQHSGE